MAAFAGGYLDASTFAVAPAQAAAILRGCDTPSAPFAPVTMEMIVFGARPYYLARDVRSQARLLPADAAVATGTAAGASASAPTGCIGALPLPALLEAAQRVVPGAPWFDSTLLTSYDAYYYDRTQQKPSPVVRVRFADPRKTWLYLDPGTARIAARYTDRSRAECWNYQVGEIPSIFRFSIGIALLGTLR